MDPDVEGLRRWFLANDGYDAEIVDCDKGSAGFSNETWSLTVNSTGGLRHLILRKPRTELKFFPKYDLGFQYSMLKSLYPTAVPAPTPLAIEYDTTYIGTPFYLMERIAPASGVVPIDGPPSGIHGMGLFFDATERHRTQLWHSAIDALVAIHGIDLDGVAFPFPHRPTTLREVVAEQLDTIEAWHRHGSPDPIPTLAKASALLRNDIPDQDDIVLCWGDPKPGNMVFVNGEVVGVLDWEMSYYGVPEMDVMYWIATDEVSASSYGIPRLPGCLDAADTIAYYEQASGRRLRNLEYHKMFQTLRLATLLVLADRVVAQMGLSEYFPDNWATNNEPYRAIEAML